LQGSNIVNNGQLNVTTPSSSRGNIIGIFRDSSNFSLNLTSISGLSSYSLIGRRLNSNNNLSSEPLYTDNETQIIEQKP